MLGQRIMTAVVLLLIVIPTLWWHDPRPFTVLSVVVMGCAAWEWAVLSAFSKTKALVAAALFVAWMGFWWGMGWHLATPWWGWWILSLLWTGILAWALTKRPEALAQIPPPLRAGLGWILLFGAWLGLLYLHQKGVMYLLSVMLLVWVSDISAYFGGRAWGRAKLAPHISPGKTWAGVYTAMVAVLVLGGVGWGLSHDLSDHPWLIERHVFEQLTHLGVGQWWGLVVGGLAWMWLTAMGVGGDLLESMCKRFAGMKDSSNLLPGHGGFLDRIDALLPVLPWAACLSEWAGL